MHVPESKFEIDLEPTVDSLRYAEASPNHLLDLYLPEDMSHQPPLVVAIHGGRFSLGNRRWELLNVPQLLEAGYPIASVEYRLVAEARFPAAVQDCKAAVRWLRTHASEFGYDPRRLVAWGRSAGGHLAAMLGATGGAVTALDDAALADTSISAQVQAVVDWYGPSDFALMDAHFASHQAAGCHAPIVLSDSPDSPITAYLGASPAASPDLARESNPITYLTRRDPVPPFFLATGDADCKVPFQQSLVLAEALRAVDADVELRVLPGIGHGAVEFEEQLTPVVLDWLAQRGLAAHEQRLLGPPDARAASGPDAPGSHVSGAEQRS
jgi:acetyl esterase/lipase